jgi:NAD(P)-dependent dehydrogenase (short-subunit alcohol dehydrogenase family)
MNIALTGANGFIGKILRSEMEKAGHNVIAARTDVKYNCVFVNADCLIHCARHHGYITGDITPEKWHGEFETDVRLAHEYTMMMVERCPNLNNIIFISSIYGKVVPTVRYIPENYIVCKAAEQMLAKLLAVRLAPKIRVNTVILGGVLSDRAEALQDEPGFREAYGKKTLTGRMTLPDEVAGAGKFLGSDESKGMAGTEIEIKGGDGVR